MVMVHSKDDITRPRRRLNRAASEDSPQLPLNIGAIAPDADEPKTTFTEQEKAAAMKPVLDFLECAKVQGRPYSDIVEVTPVLAAALLDRNPINRKMSPTTWRPYLNDMQAGRWRLNGQNIIVADTGELNDGQHRLYAVIQYGHPVPMSMIFGVARETRSTVDFGRTRTAGDVLSINSVTHGNIRAAMARAFLLYNLGKRLAGSGTSTQSVSRAEIVEFCHVRADEMNRAMAVSHIFRKGARDLGSLSAIALVAMILLRAGAKQSKVEQFFISLTTGANLDVNDPILMARMRVLRDHRSVALLDRRVELFLRAWNSWIKGRKAHFIPIYDTLPKIEI